VVDEHEPQPTLRALPRCNALERNVVFLELLILLRRPLLLRALLVRLALLRLRRAALLLLLALRLIAGRLDGEADELLPAFWPCLISFVHPLT
jgi:hypothetical protein